LSTSTASPGRPPPDTLLYLIEKYHMEQNRVFCVGDRTLDMVCPKNAGVRGIFYSLEGQPVLNRRLFPSGGFLL